MKSSRIASTAIILAFSMGAALAADLPARKGTVTTSNATVMRRVRRGML